MARSRRMSQGIADRPWAVPAAVVLLLLLAGGSWLWLRSGDGDQAPDTAAAADTAAPVATPSDTAVDLPPPDSADPVLRELVGRLSEHPRLAEWLVTEDLARRFVGAVVKVGSGLSPREELGFADPEGSFRVRERGADTAVIDPTSYERYDPAVEAFVSLDTGGTADLYRRLKPLFQQVYRGLGFPRDDFDVAMAKAVETLLAVPVPEAPVPVVPTGGEAWAYRDPDLEELAPAKKHLLRMGPENVRRVQGKLRELSEALELPTLPVESRRDTAS